MKPLLAHVYSPHRITYPCYVQPKLNGIRALYQGGHFQSRDQLPFPPGLLKHLATPLREVFDKSVILDGELYVHGWPLQRINAAVTPVRQQPTEDTLKVEYHVFDVVNFSETFLPRFGRQEQINRKISGVNFVRTCIATDCSQADLMYSGFVREGYEGMMYRLGDCPYTVPKQERTVAQSFRLHGEPKTRFLSDKDNRCWHLLKRKSWMDDEFTCFAVEEGEGKLSGTLGAVCCYSKNSIPETDARQYYKSITQLDYQTELDFQRVWKEMSKTFSVGSGLTDSERTHFWANPPIGHLVKVKYLCLSSDGIPLNPTILTIL